jgi:hypothetical protein
MRVRKLNQRNVSSLSEDVLTKNYFTKEIDNTILSWRENEINWGNWGITFGSIESSKNELKKAFMKKQSRNMMGYGNSCYP